MSIYDSPRDHSNEAISLLGFMVAALVSIILLFLLIPSLGVLPATALAVLAAIAALILDSTSVGYPRRNYI